MASSALAVLEVQERRLGSPDGKYEEQDAYPDDKRQDEAKRDFVGHAILRCILPHHVNRLRTTPKDCPEPNRIAGWDASLYPTPFTIKGDAATHLCFIVYNRKM